MFSDNEKNKMSDFIKTIMLDPVLFYDNPSDSEENIALFYYQNEKIVLNKLSQKGYFPGHIKEDIESNFFKQLQIETIKKIKERIKKLIFSQLSFSFIKNSINHNGDIEYLQDMIYVAIEESISDNRIRRVFSVVMKVLNFKIIDKYCQGLQSGNFAFMQESGFYDTHKIGENELSDYLKILFLLSISGLKNNKLQSVGIKAILNGKESFFENIVITEKDLLSKCKQDALKFEILPVEIFYESYLIHYRLDSQILPPIASRLCRAFFIFAKFYKHNTQTDDGAQPFEKSLISLLLKNYNYYSLDLSILRKMLQIATENNW